MEYRNDMQMYQRPAGMDQSMMYCNSAPMMMEMYQAIMGMNRMCMEMHQIMGQMHQRHIKDDHKRC